MNGKTIRACVYFNRGVASPLELWSFISDIKTKHNLYNCMAVKYKRCANSVGQLLCCDLYNPHVKY